MSFYKFLFAAACSLLLFFWSSDVRAGLILQRPLYIGLTDGLVGHWTFDGQDMAGERAFDRSGNSNTGLLTNGPVRRAGKIGQALEFDGVNDYVDIGTGPASVNTVAFWVYPKTATEFFVNVTGTTDYISSSAGTISATGFSSPTIYVDGIISSVLVANQWQHVAVTTATAENASNLDIGRTQDVDTIQGFMDDVRIYNRALSADEIKRLYRIGATLKLGVTRTDTLTDGLVGHWTFDGRDMAGERAFDRSGNSNTGLLTNGPVRRAGKIGQALEFDGSNDLVNAGAGASLNNLAAITISAWIYPRSEGEGGNAAVVTKRDNGAGGGGWLLEFASAGTNALNFLVEYDLTALERTTANNAISLNTWQHIVVTWDGSTSASNARIYVNGSETSYQTTINASGTKDDDALRNFILGEKQDNSNFTFDGLIDDVRIYNRALSADEIKRLYTLGR